MLNKKKIFFAFIFNIFILFLQAKDFKNSCSAGQIWLDFENCSEKLLMENPAFVKGDNVLVKGHYSSEKTWKHNYSTGPNYNKETGEFYFKVGFKKKYVSSWTTNAVLSGKVFIDNSIPDIYFEGLENLECQDNTWSSSQPINFVAVVPSDISDHNKKGSGFSVIKYSVDNSSYKELSFDLENNTYCTFEFTEEGKHSIIFYLKDRLGNEKRCTYNFIIDLYAPEIKNIIHHDENKWYRECLVEAEGFDSESGVNEKSWAYSLDGGLTWSDSSSENNKVIVKKEGKNSVKFKVQDNAGNLCISDSVINVNIDRTLPEIYFEDKSNFDKWLKKEKIIIYPKAKDNLSSLDFESFKYSFDDGKNWTSFNYKNGIEIKTEGITNVKLSVSDFANNTLVTDNYRIMLDNKEGVISVDESQCNKWLTKAFISAELSDDISGCDENSWQYSLDKGVSWSEADKNNKSLTFSENGKHEIIFKACDNAGNESVSKVYTLMVDSSGCKIYSDFDFEKIYSFKDLVKINFFAENYLSGVNEEGFFVLFDGEKYLLKENLFIPSTDIEDGMHSLKFGSVTNAGVESLSEEYIFKTDTSLPFVKCSTEKKDDFVNIKASFYDSSSGVKEFYYRFDSDDEWSEVDLASCIFENEKYIFTLNLPFDSDIVLEFLCKDNAGNFIQSSVKSLLPVPEIDIHVKVENSALWSKENKVSASSSSKDIFSSTWRYELFLDSKFVKNHAGNVARLKESGNYEIIFYVKDKYENEYSSDKVFIKIDASKPEFDNELILEKNKVTVMAKDEESGVDEESFCYSFDGGKTFHKGKTALLKDGNNQEILFSVKDKVGNKNERKYKVSVDTSAPELDLSSIYFNNDNVLTFKELLCKDLTSGLKSLYLESEGIEKLFLEDYKENDKFLDFYLKTDFSIEEGKYKAFITAEDNFGNTVKKETFIISDKTSPLIKKIDFYQNDKVLKEKSFIFPYSEKNNLSLPVKIKTDAYDDILLDKIKIYISSEDIVIEDNFKTYSYDFELFINNEELKLKEGKNYIFIKVIDAAGNESELYKSIIFADSLIPEKPEVKSLTHKRAEKDEDAASEKNPYFYIEPSLCGAGGLSAYYVTLMKAKFLDTEFKIIDILEKERFIASEKSSCFTFENLEDNEKGQCYLLSVKALSENGAVSEEEFFAFRVDTRAPEKLKLETFPSGDSLYTNAEEIILKWNIPDDCTGVKEFVLNFYDDKNKLLNSQLLNGSKRSYSFNPGNLLKEKYGGKIKIELISKDYADNFSSENFEFNYDFEKPEVKNDINIENTKEDFCKISWPEVKDFYSGLNYVECKIFSLDNSDYKKTLYADESSFELIFKDIPLDGAFALQIKFFDKAKNFTLKEKYFTRGSALLPEVLEKDLDESYKGFDIKAKIKINNTFTEEKAFDIKLFANDFIKIYEKSSEEESTFKSIDCLTFEDCVLLKDKVIYENILNGKNGKYRIKVKNLSVDFTDYTFDFAGLTLKNSVFYFGEEKYLFDSITVKDLRTLFLSSSIQVNDLNIKSSTFEYKNISSFYIQDDFLLFENKNGIEIFNENFLFEKENNKNYSFSVKKNLESKDVNCDLNNLILILKNQKIHVQSAKIINDVLYVYDSYFILPEGLKSDEKDESHLILRNYFLDGLSGKVTCSDSFYSSQIINEKAAGVKSKAQILSDGSIISSGLLDLGVYGKNIFTEGFLLTSEGLSNNAEIAIPSFETTLFGFKLKVIDSSYKNEKLYINDAYIYIYENRLKVSKLVLALDAFDKVLEECSLESISFNCKDYGAFAECKTLSIKKSGIHSSVMYLDSLMGKEPLVFDDVLLFSDGKIKASSMSEQMLVFGNSQILFDEAFFDGKKVTLSSPEVILPEGFEKDSVIINKIEVNAEKILSEYKIKDLKSSTYIFDGWKGKFDEVYLCAKGFKGKCKIEAEYLDDKSAWKLLFDNFTLTFDNLIEGTSIEDSEAYFSYNGYLVNMEDSFFRKDEKERWRLCCRNPEVCFNDFSVASGLIEFLSDGKLILSKEGGESYELVTPQGISVIPDKVNFSEGLLNFTGKIKAEFLGDYIDLNGKELQFTESGFIGGSKIEGEFGFTFDNQNISSKCLTIDGLKLLLENSEFEYEGQGIALGTIAFFNDGRICDSSSVLQNKSIIVNGVNALLYRAGIDSDGISLGVKYFADTFFTAALCFENLRFLKDGSAFSNFVYDKLETDTPFGKVLLKNLRLTKGSIEVEEMILEFASLDNARLVFKGVSFDSNGNFVLKGSNSTSFNLWNMTFYLSEASYKNSKFKISGSIVLPSELPGILAGRKLKVSEFVISKSGNIEKFSAKLDEKVAFNIFGNWTVEANKPGLEITNDFAYLVFKEAKLNFPPGFALSAMGIKGLKFNLRKLDFDLENVFVQSDTEFEYFGINFKLDSMTLGDGISFKGSAVCLSDEYPPFLKNKKLKVNKFEIKKDGSFGDIDILLEGLEGRLSKELSALELKKGSISFENKGKSELLLKIKGGLLFTESAPEFLRNCMLSIEDFTIDVSSQKITSLKASFKQNVNAFYYFSGCQLRNLSAYFEFKNNLTDSYVDLKCRMTLPVILPEADGLTEVEVSKFKINLDGQISEFDFSVLAENMKYEAFELSKASLSASYKDQLIFTLKTKAKLNEKLFPKGFGGLTSDILLKFSPYEIIEAKGEFLLSKSEIFDSLIIEDGKLVLEKEKGKALLLKASGNVTFGNTFPESIRGITMKISDLSFTSNGDIFNADISVKDLDFYIFENVRLCDSFIKIVKNTNKNMFVSIGGDLLLEGEKIPDELKKVRFCVDEFIIDSSGNIKSFIAGLNSSVNFKIVNGLDFTLKSLSFNKEGFEISAAAKLALPFFAVQEAEFELKKLTMDWNGNIKELKGGLGHCNILLAGFNGEINGLSLIEESGLYKIALKECFVKMPENFGSLAGNKIGIQDAYFDPLNLDFKGKFMLESITTEIAGFILKCNRPSLDINDKKIKFKSVELGLPDFLGSASFSLSDVYISSSSGLRFAGGKFSLPDFSIGQAGFKNISAHFAFDDKGQYFISASGGIIIPNAGEISASLSFTNVTKQYPIGIRHAYFSYESYVAGIPLGTTGLCLCGIRGGFGFGFPEEVPEKYRSVFGENGKRLELGLTVKDQESMGKLAVIKADCWIDITKVAWVFEGNATILSGTFNISASSVSIIKSDVFATGMKIQILFLRGNIEFYIFDLDGKVKFSGKGSLGIRIPKGFLLDTDFFTLPRHDMWLIEVGTMFGDFTNGKRGFLGYVDINICGCRLGRVGAFIGSGGLKLDVKNYDILRPEGISLKTINTNSQVRANIRSLAALPSLKEESSYTNERSLFADKGDRIVFAVGYQIAMPDFVLESPSGKIFTKNSLEIECAYFDGGYLLAFDAFEEGRWKFSVEGAIEGTYEIEAFGFTEYPEVTFKENESYIYSCSDSFLIEGSVAPYSEKVEFYAAKDKESAQIYLGSADCDKKNNFSFTLDTALLEDGEYFIFARALCLNGFLGEETSSEWKIRVDRSNKKMLVPEDFKVNMTREDKLMFTWQGKNGKRDSGFYFYSKNIETGKITKDNLGNIKKLVLDGEYCDNYEFALSSYDLNNKESEKTSFIKFIPYHKTDNTRINSIFSYKKDITFSVESGEKTECYIDFECSNFMKKDSVHDFVIAGVEENENSYENIHLSFKDQYKIEGINNRITFSLYADDKCPEIEKTFVIYFYNQAYPDDVKYVNLHVNVISSQVNIDSVLPSVIDGEVENKVRLFGKGFSSASKFYLDEKELSVISEEENNLNTVLLSIPKVSEKGPHIISVISSNGKVSEALLNVRIPYYSLVLYSTEEKVSKGESAYFPLSAASFCGFNKKINIYPVNSFDGIKVEVPELYPEETESIKISVEEDCVEGDYVLHFKTDSEFEFYYSLCVTENKKDDCEIKALSKMQAYAGETVIIYGSGFDKKGKVSFAGKNASVKKWTDREIEFIVPSIKEHVSDFIKVKTSKGKSDSIRFTVLSSSYGFNIERKTIVLEKDMETFINIDSFGKGGKINLELDYNNQWPFKIWLEKESLKNNDSTKLYIKASENLYKGSFDITVKAFNGSYYAERTLTVKVLVTEEITDELVLNLTEKSFFERKLDFDGFEEPSYSIVENTSLLNISLDKEGILKGKINESGEYFISIKVENEKLSEIKKIKLNVKKDFWNTENKNSNNNIFSDSEIPAEEEVLWSFEFDKKINYILAYDDKECLVFEKGFQVIDINGNLLWHNSDSSSKVSLLENKVIFIDENMKLKVQDLNTGLLLYEREGVLNYFVCEKSIFVFEKEKTLELEVKSLNVVSIFERPYTSLENISEAFRKVFYSEDKNIKDLNGDIIFTSESKVCNIVSDINYLYVICDNCIYILDPSFKKIKSILHEEADDTKLSSDNECIYISSSEGLSIYSKKDFSLISFIKEKGNFIPSNEKIIFYNQNELSVYNPYSAKKIWSRKEKCDYVMVYKSRIYSASDNVLTCFAGRTNVNPPEITFIMDIPNPDGNNGWYKNKPLITVEFDDAETYVKDRFLTVNSIQENELKINELKEGLNTIKAWASDSKALKSKVVTKEIALDTLSPESEIYTLSEMNQKGWFNSSVIFGLKAKDETSGVEKIIVDGKIYERLLEIKDEGLHEIEYYSVDKAGNVEEAKKSLIKIDHSLPEVNASFKVKNGFNFLEIDAEDKISGISKVEYRFDEENIYEYKNSFPLLNKMPEIIEYRAVDNSGLTSPWQKIMLPESNNTYSHTIFLAEVDGRHRKVMPYITTGCRLYDSAFSENFITSVPEEMYFCEYILLDESDALTEDKKLLSFYVLDDCEVMLLSSDDYTSENWDCLKKDFDCQNEWFKGKTSLFRKKANAGEKIVIEFKDKMPLVAVKNEEK